MVYNLIAYDTESGGYENISNYENWSLADYYENGVKQPDDVKDDMFKEMQRRASHNIWTVVSRRGTAETIQFCKDMEKALQEKKDFEIHLGFIRLKN